MRLKRGPVNSTPTIVSWAAFPAFMWTMRPCVEKSASSRAAGHDLWYVYSATTIYGTRCEDMLTALASARPVQRLVAPDGAKYFEYMGLARFPPRP